MKAHPTVIAQELKTYSFFKALPEALLLQIASMMDEVQFNQGDLILKEGAENRTLYFLREGRAEVLLANEVVAILQAPGEVMGEVSVVSHKPVSASIRAGTYIRCLAIHTSNFDHLTGANKEQFQALIYQMYSVILTERLRKTNEKARLFEITSRELAQAQMSLDRFNEERSVLLVEKDMKHLSLAKIALGATGVKLSAYNEADKAKVDLENGDFDVIVADETNIPLMEWAHAKGKKGELVLITNKEISANFNLLQSADFLQTVVSRDSEDRNFSIRILLTTLAKILYRDRFGLEKYLTWGVEVQERFVKSSEERESVRSEMVNYFKKFGIRTTILDRANLVAEEMLMNAIYDAPMDKSGKSLFNHLPRTTTINLEPDQQAVLRYSTDGGLLAVSVTDFFGGLTRSTVLKYLESCYSGNAGKMNESEGKGGAGRGLHQIIENSDITIFNVRPKDKTEVICLFHLDVSKQAQRPSVHYFFS